MISLDFAVTWWGHGYLQLKKYCFMSYFNNNDIMK